MWFHCPPLTQSVKETSPEHLPPGAWLSASLESGRHSRTEHCQLVPSHKHSPPSSMRRKREENLVHLAVDLLPQNFPILAALEELPAFTSLPRLQVAMGSPCGQVLFCIATSALAVLECLSLSRKKLQK
ncbi:hypothetical protein DV515_00014507 [Chloebia gouldiae]|uniref:Uncharacterized protein n=1 Tax=Chloebia gouldiae TaxID=44316 RepID=A0A3L8RXW1_CHLGU|nr:hypothetical protein DV515_00014507 [Chloebia gouldiae]